MILILAVATACANTITDTNVDADNSKADGGDASSPERNVSGSDELDDPDESDVLAEKLNEELNEEAADSKTEDATSDQESLSTVPIEKMYYMNKNYFIKPINEHADKKVVLLTFDDGPKERELLTSLLDTLDKHDAKAIFFVNGFRVQQNPDLVELIYDRGQILGNHSWDHIDLKKQSEDMIDDQIIRVQTEVEAIIGSAPVFFRPPHGSGNSYIRDKVKELGMLYMTWSNGSLDWADNKNNPDGVIKSVMDQLLPGSNILMHELSWTAEALDSLLTQITEAGYTFVHPDAIELDIR